MKAKDLIFLPLLVPLLILAGCGGASGSDSGSSSAGSRGSTAELVSISVTPGNPNVPADVNGQLTAFGTYSDGTTSDITPQVT